jgi:endonuclease/exonuclease/phosphatase family metal-dependent hydrolase
VKQNNACFTVVSVHFAPDDYYLSQANRRKCMDVLLRFVNEQWPNEHVFIVGDFNIYNMMSFKDEMLSNTGFKTLLSDDETTNMTRTEPYDHILIPRFATAGKAVVIDLNELVKAELQSVKGQGSQAKSRI